MACFFDEMSPARPVYWAVSRMYREAQAPHAPRTEVLIGENEQSSRRKVSSYSIDSLTYKGE